MERNAADEMQAAEAAGAFHYSAPLPLVDDDEEEEESEEGFADATENLSKLSLNHVGAAPFIAVPPPVAVMQPTPTPPPQVQVHRPNKDPDPMDDDFGDDGGDLDLNDPEVRKLMEEDFDDEDDLLN